MSTAQATKKTAEAVVEAARALSNALHTLCSTEAGPAMGALATFDRTIVEVSAAITAATCGDENRA